MVDTPIQYLVMPTMGLGQRIVDGVVAAIVVMDSTVKTTPALQEAQAVSVLNAAGYNLPSGYFTSSVALETASLAHFVADGDFIVFGQFRVLQSIAATVTEFPVK